MCHIAETWGPLRSVLESSFTFGTIKEIMGLAGFDMCRVSGFQQGSGGASKSQLMTAIDGELGQFNTSTEERFFRIVAEEMLRRKPALLEQLQELLNRLGWTLHEGTLVPVELFDLSELPELPDSAVPDLVKAATRLRNGDLGGALSAACAAVDAATSSVYEEEGLGVPGRVSYQERVNTALRVQGTLPNLEQELVTLGWDVNKVTQFKNALASSVNHIAFLMQTLRSRMGDVHGTKPIFKPLVYDAFKWATVIVRLLKEA